MAKKDSPKTISIPTFPVEKFHSAGLSEDGKCICILCTNTDGTVAYAALLVSPLSLRYLAESLVFMADGLERPPDATSQ